MKLTRTIALTAAVTAALAAAAPAQALTLRTGGSTGFQLLASKLAASYHASHPTVTITVAGGGSGAGINGAANGTYNIGNSSRDPKGSDPSGLTFTPITKEPIVVIRNPANPKLSLTKAQVKGIFTGSITRWSQVGWAGGGTIKVYTRIGTSGTLASFSKLFLDGAAVKGSAIAEPSNGLMRTAVHNNRAAIGFVTYAYTVNTTAIRSFKIGGVVPSLRNIINGTYKYWNFQYFVTKGAPAGATSRYIYWARHNTTAKSIISRYAVPTTAAAKHT